jgi:diguanylate cyclase (GGDEF)-like protein
MSALGTISSFQPSEAYRNQSVDDKLYGELVRSLYSTPKSILAASLVALSISFIALHLSGDRNFLGFLIAYCLIGTFRLLMTTEFKRRDQQSMGMRALRFWETGALAGAWTFSGVTGLIGAYSTVVHPGSEAEILTSCCAIGYIAGISSRNASRPLITIGQISAICIPFFLGLVSRADVLHATLAIFILCLFASTIAMSRSMHENIVLRHRAYAELEKSALYDALTGLKNRSAFIQLINRYLAGGGEDTKLALVAVDLDRFKDVNDRLGHPAGDAVLKEAARRIARVTDMPHETSRIGGDEFLIALAGVNADQAHRIAERIRAALAADFSYGPIMINCGASVGFAVGPEHGRTYDELMRSADLALYSAKSNGRGQVVAYSEVLREAYDARIELEYDMRSAITHSELELVYQPVVDPRSGRVISCEALLRWNHLSRGTISPNEFIPIAEATGLIVPIGAWVLQAACSEAVTWPGDIKVAVNLSPLQFRRGREIVETVKEALRQSGLPPHRLELEVTESVLIDDTESTLAIIEELRAEGIGVSLDDFGTGFSSLGYLNDFPFSKLKIDRKFCQNVSGSARTRSIIKGISQLTRDLGIELVAEGIENREQLDCITDLGVNAVQGFVFCEPMLPVHLRSIIREPLVVRQRLGRLFSSGVARRTAA